MKYYTDAGTAHNGQKGYQETRVCIFNANNEMVLDEYIGDYSNNEGELVAIGRCLQLFGVTVIKTDSKTAQNWVLNGWTKQKEKGLLKGKLTQRHKVMIQKAHALWLKSGCEIEWISRSKNLAGIYLETMYSI